MIPQLATVLRRLKEQAFAAGHARPTDLVFTVS
jgi:hypothetical protein